MAGVLKIAARAACFVIDDLRQRRIPVDGLLDAVGLSRADLATPEALVPYSAVTALTERAAIVVGDASYGLRLGASREARDGGLLAFVMLNSPTLMDASSNLERPAS